jgi:hypothetical protein
LDRQDVALPVTIEGVLTRSGSQAKTGIQAASFSWGISAKLKSTTSEETKQKRASVRHLKSLYFFNEEVLNISSALVFQEAGI